MDNRVGLENVAVLRKQLCDGIQVLSKKHLSLF